MSTMNLSVQHSTGALQRVLPNTKNVARTKKASKRAAARPLQGPRRALFGIPAVLPLFPSVSIYTPDYEGDGFR